MVDKTKSKTDPERKNILLQVGENFRFFQSRWKEFCEAVEKAGEILKDYASKPEQKEIREERDDPPEYKKLDKEYRDAVREYETVEDDREAEHWHKLATQKQKELMALDRELLKQGRRAIEGPFANWTPYSYIQHACMRSKFLGTEADIYVPPDALSYMYCAGVVLPKDGNEDFLLNCAVLCIAYDNWIDVDEPRVYYHGSYKGEYLDCDACAQRLWAWLQNKSEDDRIQRAWLGVKDHLPSTKPPESELKGTSRSTQDEIDKLKNYRNKVQDCLDGEERWLPEDHPDKTPEELAALLEMGKYPRNYSLYTPELRAKVQADDRLAYRNKARSLINSEIRRSIRRIIGELWPSELPNIEEAWGEIQDDTGDPNGNWIQYDKDGRPHPTYIASLGFRRLIGSLDYVIGELEEPKVKPLGAEGDVTDGGENEPKEDYVFRRLGDEGDMWIILYEGEETSIRNTLGIQYIHYLVKNKGRLLSCLDIEKKCQDEPKRSPKQADESTLSDDSIHVGELNLTSIDKWDKLDPKILYAQREQWRAEANKETDPSRLAELNELIDKMDNYIGSILNKNGKARPGGSVEKCRKRVSMAINEGGKKKIREKNELIGKHFDAAIKGEGISFMYEPGRSIGWVLS